MRQQLILVDDERNADDEQYPGDNDADDNDAQAQVKTGLLSCRIIAARPRS